MRRRNIADAQDSGNIEQLGHSLADNHRVENIGPSRLHPDLCRVFDNIENPLHDQSKRPPFMIQHQHLKRPRPRHWRNLQRAQSGAGDTSVMLRRL